MNRTCAQCPSCSNSVCSCAMRALWQNICRAALWPCRRHTLRRTTRCFQGRQWRISCFPHERQVLFRRRENLQLQRICSGNICVRLLCSWCMLFDAGVKGISYVLYLVAVAVAYNGYNIETYLIVNLVFLYICIGGGYYVSHFAGCERRVHFRTPRCVGSSPLRRQ